MNNVMPLHQNPRLSAALAYASLGWHILPCWWAIGDKCACGSDTCKSPAKHPIAKLVPWGQNSATTDPERIKQWFDAFPEASIAAYLEPSNLVAIDIDPRNGGLQTIDDIEAKHGPLVSDLLQFTGGGGEHRVFMRPINTQMPGKLGAGVDVKANGYIMLEPSNHISGGSYSWEASSDPRDGVMASPLPDWLRDLAAPKPVGSQDEPAQGRVVGVSEDTKAELIEALQAIPSDDRDVWRSVGMALQSIGDPNWAFAVWDGWSRTSHKYNLVDQTRVWRSFKAKGLDGITYKTIFGMAKELGVVVNLKKKPAPVDSVVSEATLAAAQIVPIVQDVPVPQSVFNPPGILKTSMQWMIDSSNRPQPLLALVASLSMVATVLANKIENSRGGRTNFYFVGVAGTGAGKDHGRKCIKTALTSANLGHLLGGESIASGQALMTRTCMTPNALFQPDEFGLWMKAANAKNAPAHQKALIDNLMKLFSSTGTVLIGTEYADQKIKSRLDVSFPCVNVHGTTTPEPLFESLTGSEIVNGFLNRLLIVFAEDKYFPLSLEESDAPPDSLIQWLQAAASMSQGIRGLAPEAPIRIQMGEGVREVLDGCNHVEQTEKGKPLGGLWARYMEQTWKMALLCSCARIDDPETLTKMAETGQLVISKADAEWSRDFVQWAIATMVKEASWRVADSEHERNFNNCVRAIEDAGMLGLTMRELGRAKGSGFAKLRPFEKEELIKDMRLMGRAQLIKFPAEWGRGKCREHLVGTFYAEQIVAQQGQGDDGQKVDQ